MLSLKENGRFFSGNVIYLIIYGPILPPDCQLNPDYSSILAQPAEQGAGASQAAKPQSNGFLAPISVDTNNQISPSSLHVWCCQAPGENQL